jgi:nucleoid-associated protein YgaU
MGLFKFVSTAGDKLFGGNAIDEKKVLEHIQSLGLKIKPLAVVAHQPEKMVSLIGYAETLQDKEKAILAAGNIKGVEKVDDRIKLGSPPARAAAPATVDEAPEPEAAEVPDSKFYTVKSGDTLSKIAREFYGDAGKYPVIFEANKPMVSDPDRIYPGQVLRIPKIQAD